MSKELMTVETAKVTDAELTMHLENLGLLKDLSVGEKNSYLQIAKAFNLNPFKREIHVSKYNGQMSIITGYEVYIKRAERTGQLDGWNVVTTGSVKTNDLKATITIYRKDRSHPFVWEAEYSEFVQKTKEGNVTKFWQKATMMIKKVAISQGFRLCFSDELGGMPYTADEMPENTIDTVAEITTKVKTGGEAPNHNDKELSVWQPTAAEMQELSELVDNSTLEDKRKEAARIAITECRTPAAVAKIKTALLKSQPNE